MKYRILLLLLCGFIALQAQVPNNYYSNAYNKSGQALCTALHDIISNHTALSYSGLWEAYKTTDKRLDNGKVWDIYSDVPNGTPAYYFDWNDKCGSYSTEGDCYNREHSVPQSWFNEAAPMKTDLFHIYPTDGKVNSQRGNYAYGEVSNANWTSTNGSQRGSCATAGYSGIVFEPIDAYKGDLARTYFYMAVCYMDKNLGQTSESMFNGGSLKPWALNMLIRWHNQDPVSTKEVNRNNAVYSIQHNRNPFIDYPELVDMIFGNQTNVLFNPNGEGEDDPNGINDLCFQKNWSVYPNPAIDNVYVTPSKEIEGDIDVDVWTITGQRIKSISFSGEATISFNVSDLNPGVYILKIATENSTVVKKLAVE